MLGLGTVAKKVFGTPNDRKIKSVRPLVEKINALEPAFRALDDEGLRTKTTEFRERLAKGETLDDLLPEAFANAREAARRTLGLRPFDVQLMGGIFLHQGNISEMKTGEGKTLMATLPVYLNALTGRGVHVVTVNDYLAKRDADWMGLVYHALGMTVGVVDPEHARGPEEGRLRRRRHLRDQQRARLRLPARQHEVRPRPGPPARSLFRHRRRGRLDPDRRGADAAHHLRPERGPLGALHRHRQAHPRAPGRALRPRREAAHRDADRGGQRVRRGPPARDGPPRPRRDDVRPREHQHRPPRQPGAARPCPFPPGQGLYRQERRGDAHRRVHRPHDAGPAPLRGAAPGDRGEGERGDPPRERHARERHLPELLPPLREARRHDRHRRDRGRRVLRDLQARRRRGADQHAGDPQGPRRPGLPHRPREVRLDRRGDQARQRGRAADPRRHHLDREVRDPLGDAQEGQGSAQRPQRPLPRAGGLDRRRGRRPRRRHHRHQHGRPRHRHPARRQRRHARRHRARDRREGRSPRRPRRAPRPHRGRDRRGQGARARGRRPLCPRHRAPREPAHRQPAPRPLRPPGRPGADELLPEPRGRPHADLRVRPARTRCSASSG